jgi:hypothetical protein
MIKPFFSVDLGKQFLANFQHVGRIPALHDVPLFLQLQSTDFTIERKAAWT